MAKRDGRPKAKSTAGRNKSAAKGNGPKPGNRKRPAAAGRVTAQVPAPARRRAPRPRQPSTKVPLRSLKGSRILVTGGAGFIGSHAVEALVAAGAKVTVVDNLSAGRREWLHAVERSIVFVQGDAGDPDLLDRLLPGMDSVWHLAANPEVRTGETDPAGHYEQNVAVTFRLLEAMRRHQVRHLAFTSTSTVYGRAAVLPTPEDYGPLLPISVYGACKLACEALIAAYAGTFGMDALLFRFANVVGPRSTHGVTYDFVRKLRQDPKSLEILGDGRQTKSYVSVADTVAGMLHAASFAPPGAHPYNIGSRDAIPVTRIAEIVAATMGLRPKLRFSGGAPDGAGWVGDVKAMALDVGRLRGLGPGWAPGHSSAQAIRIAAEALVGPPSPSGPRPSKRKGSAKRPMR